MTRARRIVVATAVFLVGACTSTTAHGLGSEAIEYTGGSGRPLTLVVREAPLAEALVGYATQA